MLLPDRRMDGAPVLKERKLIRCLTAFLFCLSNHLNLFALFFFLLWILFDYILTFSFITIFVVFPNSRLYRKYPYSGHRFSCLFRGSNQLKVYRLKASGGCTKDGFASSRKQGFPEGSLQSRMISGVLHSYPLQPLQIFPRHFSPEDFL